MSRSAGDGASEATTMRTRGDFSPNWVGRDYTVTIQQMPEARCRQWRCVETVPSPVFKTLEAALNTLSSLTEGCKRPPDPTYRQFTALAGFVSERSAAAYTVTIGLHLTCVATDDPEVWDYDNPE